MDWDKAIAINRAALQRIVAGLFALAGLAAGAAVARLPRAVHRAVLDVLRPAESAVRRLIVIAAHRLAAGPAGKPPPLRPMPAGLARARSSGGRALFRLHDPRKRFDRPFRRFGRAGPVPRVSFIGFDPRIPLLRATTPAPAAAADDSVSARSLGRRLAAIHAALEDLPKQAKRLIRWRARRARMKEAKFRDALRPGPPPGFRTVPRHDADRVLSECHALARDLPPPDTS
jgi:hypothetical protein